MIGCSFAAAELFEDDVHRHVLLVLGPGHFIGAHPERLDLDFDLRRLRRLVPLLARRAAEQELAAGNRLHLESDIGAGDRLLVGDHVALVGLDESAAHRLLFHETRRNGVGRAGRGGNQQR